MTATKVRQSFLQAAIDLYTAACRDICCATSLLCGMTSVLELSARSPGCRHSHITASTFIQLVKTVKYMVGQFTTHCFVSLHWNLRAYLLICSAVCIIFKTSCYRSLTFSGRALPVLWQPMLSMQSANDSELPQTTVLVKSAKRETPALSALCAMRTGHSSLHSGVHVIACCSFERLQVDELARRDFPALLPSRLDSKLILYVCICSFCQLEVGSSLALACVAFPTRKLRSSARIDINLLICTWTFSSCSL